MIRRDRLHGHADQTYQGLANFNVIMYEASEEVPPVPDAESARQTARTVAEWKSLLGRPPFVFPPDRDFAAAIPPQVIPESLLATVPEGARLRFRWRFLPTDKWWDEQP